MKNSFIRFVLPVIGVVLLLGATVAPDVLPPTVWLVQQGNSTAVSAPSREAVEAFIQELVDSQAQAQVCGWEFVDLNNDGVNELVASLDYSGRLFRNTLVLISKTGDVFRTQSVPAWNVTNVSDIVKDLNNDGAKKLIVPQPLSDYEGAKCIATWKTVHQWDGNAFVDVSRRFPEMYKKRLQELTDNIQKIEGNPTLSGTEKDAKASCDYLEQEKIQRLFGNSKAGFDRAVAWMRSDDPSLRRKAVKVFADISDDQSRAYLQTLSRDRDPSVAAAAQGVLRVKH